METVVAVVVDLIVECERHCQVQCLFLMPRTGMRMMSQECQRQRCSEIGVCGLNVPETDATPSALNYLRRPQTSRRQSRQIVEKRTMNGPQRTHASLGPHLRAAFGPARGIYVARWDGSSGDRQ